MAYRDFTEMSVWKKSFKLLQKVYSVTKRFPEAERFCLAAAMN
ncbi:MAG: four helix bundle protein [Bacteroidales bacterium]|nr:four helix bundle protein [Bacteroidales bacterium]